MGEIDPTCTPEKSFTGGGDSGVASKILLLRELHESELLTYPEDV